MNHNNEAKNDGKVWQAKLAAYIHDPATKALILLRGLAHEKGSVEGMRRAIFGDPEGLAVLKGFNTILKQADTWASAADRPQLPMSIQAKVVFAEEPALIHPLNGTYFKIQELIGASEDASPEAMEALNFHHFNSLIIKDESSNDIDWRRTFLAFWRFGRCSPTKDIGALWEQLPADTRCPDHSIWEHLVLSSAFAGAMASDKHGEVALLLVSFGPVQGFISQARSVSDLWAGSHLLSTLAWQGMKVVCKGYGPDSILFPSLYRIPLVDCWLRNEMGLSEALWPQGEYPKGASDANPLFVAALPNRFLALVPAGQARTLAQEIQDSVRRWIQDKVREVLAELGIRGDVFASEQVRRQLDCFPEVNWSIVPWDLAHDRDGRLDDTRLKEALEHFGASGSYLDEGVEALVTKELKIEGMPFFTPNPGVAYPGLFTLSERLHGSAKSVRPFQGLVERGYRCSVCGEREWLTDEPEKLHHPPGSRVDTLWQRVRKDKGFSFIKEGEHLCALCALKRFWPRLFTKWVEGQVEVEDNIHRYVVSTHTMAISTSLWLHGPGGPGGGERSDDEDAHGKGEKGDCKGQSPKKVLEEKMERWDVEDRAALPFKLYQRFRGTRDLDFLKRLPVLLDHMDAMEEAGDVDAMDVQQERAEVEGCLTRLLGTRPERYYAMILMDGDRMGRWLSASGEVPSLGARFHENVLEELRQKVGLSEYLDARRPPTPAWHQAISSGLNAFAVELARTVVEEFFMGKLIYAGGDDLLAMVAVHDLPGLMLALRCVYSGHMPPFQVDTTSHVSGNGNGPDRFEKAWEWLTGGAVPGHTMLKLNRGYALFERGKQRKLLRLMCEDATASIGAVVAHHKTPLARVLTELRRAEHAAKNEGGRDAFSLTLMKRSGGYNRFTGNWHLKRGLRNSDMGLLLQLRDLLGHPQMSRRVAYILSELFAHLPSEEDVISSVIMRQLMRQGLVRAEEKQPGIIEDAKDLANSLAQRALEELSKRGGHTCTADAGCNPSGKWLREIFLTSEFLARETRFPVNLQRKGGTL